MLLAFVSNDTTKIVLWVVLAAAALGLISILLHTVVVASRSKKNGEQSEKTAEENVNSSVDAEEQNIGEASDGNIIMSRNVIYSVGIDGQINAGNYTVDNAYDATAKFNLRVNGLVREYGNGDTITLADGDTISPVSGSVRLSKTN